MENKQKNKAISRIYKDLNEIKENPIQGLSICMPDENDPFSLHCNIQILSGIYEGILLHLEMQIPENYPVQAPKLQISPGQSFSHTYHHHVFGSTICIDLLDHGFFGEGEKTGWTPAYTLSTILVQMQVFFAEDYDLPMIPKESQISDLKNQLKKFVCQIKLTDGSFKVHTFQDPYPPINQVKEKVKLVDFELEKKKKAYEKMTCFLTKTNPGDQDTVIGYPFHLTRDAFGRIEILPILETLSYDGYMMQIQNSPDKIDAFDYFHLRTASGQSFNYWFPLYGNEKIYEQFKQIFYNSVSVLKYGIEGKKQYDFNPEMVLQIFPTLMNKTIVALQKGTMFQSMAAIEAYCHWLRLFLRYLQDFPELYEKINQKVEKAMRNAHERNKTNLGDMGEFLILLSLSKYGLKHKGVWMNLIKEFLARKFLWNIKEIKSGQNIFFKNDLELFNKSPLAFFHGITTENLKKLYKARKVSNDLLLFNFAAAKKFLVDKESFIARIDSNYGVIDEVQVNEFIEEVNDIKNNIQSYEDLMAFLGLKQKLDEPKKILALFREAHQLSYVQGYTNLFVPNVNQSFLSKIDHILIIVQWFIKDERNMIFFKFLIRNKSMVFALKDYLVSQDKKVFAKFEKLPAHFFEYLEDTSFFLKNLLSHKFLFYFLTLLETKSYQQNSFLVLNKINCLQEFERNDESYKTMMNYEGILKSSIWMMILSFHELFEAIPDVRRGKIVLLQKFALFYRVILKNFDFWSTNFYRAIDSQFEALSKMFEKDAIMLKETSDFSFLENNHYDFLMCLMIIEHIKSRLVNQKNDYVKKIVTFIQESLKSTEKFDNLKNDVLKKAMMLCRTMDELDNMKFEVQMDQTFYILEREQCLKIIHVLMGCNEKNAEELKFLNIDGTVNLYGLLV